MAYKIIVDAGHGGYDGGASYNGRLEKDDTLKLALAVGEILSGMGYDVEYTRTTDVYDSPVQKARIGNESNANLFVSIHRNSSPEPNTYKGVQTLVYEDVGLKGDLARSVNDELEKVGYRNINVVERPNLAVLRRTKMPAILVEAGFINNDEDNNRFDSKFDETAMAIATGIDDVIRAAGLKAGSFNDKNDVSDVFAVEEGKTSASYDDGEEKNAAVFADDEDRTASESSDDESKNEASFEMAADMMSDEESDGISDNSNYDGYIKDVPTGKNDNEGNYQLLTGIYRTMGSAGYQMNKLINSGYQATVFEDEGLYQVRVGNFDSIEEALIASRELRDRGYETLIVIGK
ncbi:MAG: N-acetylmuramoyl-L-alanine amidase [Lachnospiraceae bacterium]|nr:N-acetylmuramoyl-L-alanine amidase [Lachnospiraceae bacterium]